MPIPPHDAPLPAPHRAVRDAVARRRAAALCTCIAAGLALLVGSGGGGGDKTSGPTPATDAFPNAQRSVGDWVVYDSTSNVTLPTASTTRGYQVRQITAANADGSYARRLQSSVAGSASTTQTYDTSGARVTTATGGANCTFTPAIRFWPAYGAPAGSTWSSNSTLSCTGNSSSVTNYTVSGNAIGTEARTFSIGSYQVFKYTDTWVTPSAGGTNNSVETCWVEKTSSRTLECQSTTSFTPTGQVSPTSASSLALTVVAISTNGVVAGPAVARFVGPWSFTLNGTVTTSCPALNVSIDGIISGNCQDLVSPGVFGTAYTASGSVTANGVVSVATATGATWSGNLTSISAGTGVWSRGGDNGSWSAAHP